jgi:hypothetical protein
MSLERSGEIGNVGKYEVEISAQGVAKATVSAKIEGGVEANLGMSIDVVELLEMLAKKTDNKVDDSMVAMIKGALGR